MLPKFCRDAVRTSFVVMIFLLCFQAFSSAGPLPVAPGCEVANLSRAPVQDGAPNFLSYNKDGALTYEVQARPFASEGPVAFHLC
jgi:hypothetical protein